MLTSVKQLIDRFSSRSLGIEITDTHIKWLEASINSGGIEIYAADAEPIASGAIAEGKVQEVAPVIQALQTVKQRNAPAAKHTNLILPSILTMVRFLELPDVKVNHLRKIIDLELQYHVPLPFDRPYYDFTKLPRNDDANMKLQTIDPVPEAAAVLESTDESESVKTGKTCDVMLVAAPLDDIEIYSSILTNVGLKPSSIEIKALSLQRLIERTNPFDPSSTYLTIDITPIYTDISMYSGGALRITRNKSLDFPASEDVENDFEFFTACQELMSEVNRFINFYRYTLNNRNQEVEHLFLSGDIAAIASVADYLGDRLQIPVHRAAISYDSPRGFKAIPNTGFAGALGAAARGRFE